MEREPRLQVAKPGRTGRLSVLVCVASLLAAPAAAATSAARTQRVYRPPGNPQFWSIAQDDLGRMYFGRAGELLVFDGDEFARVRTPGRTPVRSIAIDAGGNLFWGGRGEFGTGRWNAAGELQLTSLTHLLADEDRAHGDVWKIHLTGPGVVFQTNTHIFRLGADGRIVTWRPRKRFHFSHLVNDTLYVLQHEVGLMELVDDRLQLVAGSERLATDRLYAMLPHDRGVLLATWGEGLILWDGQRFERLESRDNDRVRDGRPYSAAVLPGGAYAIGTLRAGLLVVDRDGAILDAVDRTVGLPSNAVADIFVDRDGGTWLGLDRGLTRLEYPSPLRFLDQRAGVPGLVTGLARTDERLWISTQQGIYAMQTGMATQATGVFEQVDGLMSYSLISSPDGMLAGAQDGLYRLQNGDVQRLAVTPPVMKIYPSRHHPGRYYVLGSDWVAAIERRGGGWERHGPVKAPGSHRTAYEDDQRRLWVGAVSGGACRIDFSVAEGRFECFGAEHGLQADSTYVAGLGGEVIFTSGDAAYRFDEATGRFHEQPYISDVSRSRGWEWVQPLGVDWEGRLWLAGGWPSRIAVLDPGGAAAGINEALSRVAEMPVTEIDFDAGARRAYIGTADGVVVYDERRFVPAREPPTPLLTVTSADGGVRTLVSADPESTPARLLYSQRALRFAFALPDYAPVGIPAEIQYRLEGVDSGWSDWSHDRVVSYSLAEGSYRFRLRARDTRGRLTPEVAYSFRVLPPWHRSTTARVLYAIAFVTLAGAIGVARTRRLQHRTQELSHSMALATDRLADSDRRYRELCENASDMIFMIDSDCRLRDINRAGADLLARPHAELVGSDLHQFLDEANHERFDALLQRATRDGAATGEVAVQGLDGTPVMLELSVRPSRHDAQTDFDAVGRDVTARKILDSRLLQSQKIEAIGRLAGGIAHDFNNILTVILGGIERLLPQLQPDGEAAEGAREIEHAATRATELTGQLLTFGRNQDGQARAVDINDALRESASFLERLLEDSYRLELRLDDRVGTVWIDPSQLGQVLMNLVLNARDAMSDGGLIVLSTGIRSIHANEAPAGVAAGDYVMLSVSDHGHGMSSETRARIFEPFFSTKGADRGGLGLSLVHGIVRRCGGQVEADSTIGEGTTLTVLLPVCRTAEEPATADRPAAQKRQERGTVLLVEDNQQVGAVMHRFLAGAGYEVLSAGSGPEALEIAAEHRGAIDLLVSDVVMPGMSGITLAEKLAAVRPDTRILFVSGYPDQVLARHGDVVDPESMLKKPFGCDELLTRVAETLG